MLLGKAAPKDYNIQPSIYPWAKDLYDQAVRNTWFPHEIALKEDLDDWAKMTEDERHAVEFLISFFNPSELIVNRVLALGVYPYLKSAECHLYLAKQMWEEANHCVAFEYVLETFPIDRDRSFALHEEIPSMIAKEAFINKYMRHMTEEKLDITTADGKRAFVRNLTAYNVVMEGIWFYSGFMVALSFRQRNQLRNLGSMINWVLRDESLHLKFGIPMHKFQLIASAETPPARPPSLRAAVGRSIRIDSVQIVPRNLSHPPHLPALARALALRGARGAGRGAAQGKKKALYSDMGDHGLTQVGAGFPFTAGEGYGGLGGGGVCVVREG